MTVLHLRDPDSPGKPGPQLPAGPVTPALPGQPAPEPGTISTPVAAADAGGLGLPLVGMLLVAALALGVLVGLLARRLTAPGRPQAAGRTAGAAPAPAAWAAAEASRAGESQQRARADGLAAALVDVRDRLDNAALADRIDAALVRAGWFAIDPIGRPFDPRSQRAVDREPTGDPALHGRVASTERLGYADVGGVVLRTPEVVVHQYDPANAGRSE
jgi:hypothetical protein